MNKRNSVLIKLKVGKSNGKCFLFVLYDYVDFNIFSNGGLDGRIYFNVVFEF